MGVPGMMLWAVLWMWVCVLPSHISAQDGGWWGGDMGGDSECPTIETWCTCYESQGVRLQCPNENLDTIAQVLSLIQSPVSSLNIYGLEQNVTNLPSGIFSGSAGVVKLEIKHSSIKNLEEGSLSGLENSLESLTIEQSQLSGIPEIALHKLQSLRTLNLIANNITELKRFSFMKLKLQTLDLHGNMISQVSDFAFDGLEESLQDLNLVNNDLKSLPMNSLKKMSNLMKLQVSWNHIDDLDIPIDASFSSLQYFDASNNEIRKIKSKGLAGMPALVSLRLYMNKIASISKNAFKENPNIERVFLEHNDIQELDSDIFSHNQKISIIGLGSNNIQKIHDGIFSNLPELQELDLSRNNIREVTKETFQNSTKIRMLNLEDNAIRFLELDTFLGMTDLETLFLSFNNIQEIYPDLFYSNVNLHILKLDHNRINNLDEMTFKNTTKLTELFLQNNRLTRIKRGCFSHLTELRELYLQENMIEVVGTGAFSSLRNLETLNLQDNEILALPDTLSHNSAALRDLRVSGNYINSLHEQALSGQGHLYDLYLDRNNISVLLNGVFRDLSEVREMHLQENMITDIQTYVFANMTVLQKLYLSFNFLESIREHMFEGLASVVELHLDDNRIKEIYPNAFQSMLRLETLDLSGNEMAEIKRDIFETELPIRHLRLDNAGVRGIEEGSFEALVNLETLDLHGNELQVLQQDFLKLTQLRHLDLSGNTFRLIDANSLTGLPNLETLDLSDCNLNSIPDNFFDSSMSLQSLYLGGNRLTSLRPGVFIGLNDLLKLDVSNNGLGLNSCQAVLATTKLEYFSISGNPTRDLCPELNRLKNLREVYASNIHMTEVQIDGLLELKHLEVLDLSNNLVTEFPVGCFLGSHIRTLNLAGNQLKQLPDALFFDRMTQLKSLNVSSNPLHRLVGPMVGRNVTLPGLEQLEATRTNLTLLTSLELSHIPALRSLNLQYAEINKVSPGAFKSLSHLSHLNLAHNKLKILHRERLRGLVSLTHLNLTRNRLEKLDQLPSDSKNLKVLDASGNTLTELDEGTLRHTDGLVDLILRDNWITVIHPRAFQNLPHLETLDLSRNNLEVLRPVVFSPVERTLQNLFIHNNPVSCGCENLELWTWLLNHPAQVQQPSDLICDLPKTLNGQSFLVLPSSSFCPQPMIQRLAIQDIQSQSLLVSWQATNSSSVYGFKVTHRAVGQDHSQSSQTLNLSSRTFLLEHLEPSTEYQVCVLGLTRSLAQPHTHLQARARAHTVEAIYDKEQDNDGMRCERTQTLQPPAAPATGTPGSRLGLILGATLAAALLLGVIVAVIWYLRCRARSGHNDKRPNGNGVPPDYYSHYHVRPNHHPHQDDDDFAC